MNAPIVGPPHSVQRQILFGAVAGIIAAVLAAKFGFDPLLVTTVAAVVAATLAGAGTSGHTQTIDA
jgi:tetrahydromethanopterin S-methyltransferase subunit E